ncbi:hypothetical protein RAS1_05260 [Phycisphaerae bacterium RAS1]|nr:hypothetical protein RAS1_05260 [Phycisphaerae bacterium RAS1]
MNRTFRRAWLVALTGGAILFQLPSCVEVAATVGASASVVTAGGVLFLIRQVLR